MEEVNVKSGGLGGRVICARVVLKGNVSGGEYFFVGGSMSLMFSNHLSSGVEASCCV